MRSRICVVLALVCAFIFPAKAQTKYNFVLKSAPTSLSYAWTTGQATPAAQTIRIFDSSTCGTDPVCTFAATVASDSSWLTVSPSSGTTAFTISVGINTNGLAAGSYTGHIVATAPLLTTPTLSIPVTLAVTAAHKITLTWATGATDSTHAPATSFNILRSTGFPGTFAQVGTSTMPTYTDSTVTAGQTVCYEVEGVANGMSSPVAAATACFTIP
jgi:hypothetical protein